MRVKPIGLLVLLVFILSTPAFAQQNWPQFRGAGASGVSDGSTLPDKWNVETGENVLWKTAIPGLSHASPVIWGNKVFVSTAISSNPKPYFRSGLYGDVDSDTDLTKHTWKLYCLDKKTGKVVWERVAAEGIPKTKRHIKSTFANSTPVTDGKNVVALFGSEGLFCFDLDGKLIWKADLGVLDAGWFFDPDYQWGTASSPIIYKDVVIVQCDIQKDSFIAGYSLKTGKQIWKTSREEIPSWGTPTVYEGKSRAELVTNATRAIRSYDPASGKELWMMRGNPEVTATTPIAALDLIFICNSYRPNQPLYAIKPGGSGDISLPQGQETSDFVQWSKQRGGSYMPTPLVYGDYLYVCANHGVLTVFEARTGVRVYQQRIGDQGGAYSASPVAGDGKIYLSSEDGDVFVVKAGPKYELLSDNKVGEVIMATPAISEGMIVIRAQQHVIAVNTKQAEKQATK